MAENKSGVLDGLVVERLTGRDKLQALRMGAGYTFNSFAVRVVELTGVGCSGDQVKRAYYGWREYPHVFTAISLEWGIPEDEVVAALTEDSLSPAGV